MWKQGNQKSSEDECINTLPFLKHFRVIVFSSHDKGGRSTTHCDLDYDENEYYEDGQDDYLDEVRNKVYTLKMNTVVGWQHKI